MTRMLSRAANFVGSPQGFWLTMVLTIACIALVPIIGMTFATFVLALLAIILPALILVQQSSHDKALHMKLDDLIRATPANNKLRQIEKLTSGELDKMNREAGIEAETPPPNAG